MKKILITYCLLLFGCTVFAQVPTSGLVAEYLFSDGSYDDTNPNGFGPNNAFARTSVLTIADRFGNPNNAKDLAGIHAYMTGGTYITLGTSMDLKPQKGTISIWVNVDAISTSGWGYTFNPIILATNPNAPNSYMEGYALYTRMSDRKLLTLTSTPPSNQKYFYTDPVPLDEWHHYVMTYDDNTLQLYIDGVFITSTAKNFVSTFSNESVRVGSSLNWENNRALDGAVDDIRIYNRVLSSSEVTALYEEPDPSILPIYAELKPKLDGSFVQQIDNTLRFKFDQEYAVDPMTQYLDIPYTIYDWTQTIVHSGNIRVDYGINWEELDISTLSTGTHYTIEFKANKEERYLLRFKTK